MNHLKESLKKYQEKVKNGEIERVKPKNPLEKWNELTLEEKKRRPGWGVKAMCWECSCEQRSEITRCIVRGCPLWDIRPYQK